LEFPTSLLVTGDVAGLGWFATTGRGVVEDSGMPAPLVIAVAQPHCVSYDVAANAASHAATIGAAAAQVVVFPELSLTGYELSAPTLAVDDPRLTPIVEACAETGSVAFVGAPVAGEGGRSHIGMLAVDGAGARVVYRKMYLAAARAVDSRSVPSRPSSRLSAGASVSRSARTSGSANTRRTLRRSASTPTSPVSSSPMPT